METMKLKKAQQNLKYRQKVSFFLTLEGGGKVAALIQGKCKNEEWKQIKAAIDEVKKPQSCRICFAEFQNFWLMLATQLK